MIWQAAWYESHKLHVPSPTHLPCTITCPILADHPRVIRSHPITHLIPAHPRLDASCEAGIDVSQLRQAVQRIAGAIDTEASGNVVLSTVGEQTVV